jgi:hypothetical protein
MALSTIFANLTTSPQSLALFDTNFNEVAAMGVTQCAASGTNTIALTQNANQPTISAYANYLLFGFVAANTATGAATVNVNGIGALPLYLFNGTTQAAAGSVSAGIYYQIVYNSALNSGSGGFELLSGLPPLTSLTNSIPSNVNLNNISNFFDGPSVAQGTAGIWLAEGSVTCLDSAMSADFVAKLWDGTTTKDSAIGSSAGAGRYAAISVSGVFTNPAGNIRISVKDASSTNGEIIANDSGLSEDSTITVVRIG